MNTWVVCPGKPEETDRYRNAGLEEEEKIDRRESVATISDNGMPGEGQSSLAPIKTSTTRNTISADPYYNNSPFDLDRVNTRVSFKARSRATSRASSFKSGKSGRK